MKMNESRKRFWQKPIGEALVWSLPFCLAWFAHLYLLRSLGLIPRCLQRVNCRAGMAEVRCLPAERREGLLRQPFPPYKKTDTPQLAAGSFHF